MINSNKLTKILLYDFKDIRLLNKAMTHKSYCINVKDSYEQLEFLGDRVLGLIISDMLYQRFLNEREGDIAKRYISLVRSETLAEIAIESGLNN